MNDYYNKKRKINLKHLTQFLVTNILSCRINFKFRK